jgi:hypothetical protein
MTSIAPQRIAAIESRRDELQNAMSAPNLAPDEFVRLSKEYAEIEPVAEAAQEVSRLRAELEVLSQMVLDEGAEAELRAMAEEEAEVDKAQASGSRARTCNEACSLKDAADDRPAMLEIRAGTGGDEAALFAGDLFRMYQRYADGAGLARRADHRQRLPMSAASRRSSPTSPARACSRAEVRGRRPPRAARAGDRERRPHPHFGGHRRGAARGRPTSTSRSTTRICASTSTAPPARRAVGQHHRQRGAHHSSSDRPRGDPAGREVAAQEQGQGDDQVLRARLLRAASASGSRCPKPPGAQADGRQRRPLRAHPHL